jgi:superfamily II helicase
MGNYPNNIDSDVPLKINIEKKRICRNCGNEITDESIKKCMNDSRLKDDSSIVCLNCDPDWQRAKSEWIYSNPEFEREAWKNQDNDLNKGDSL